jgi:TolB-like protein
MATTPNKLSNLWHELKRRNVTRVLAVYIAAAFMILELISMFSDSLGLPERTLLVAFFIAIAGLVIAVIVSWLYDFQPEGGIVKTEPAVKDKTKVLPKSSNGWKIATYVSLVVIIGLLVMNILGRDKPADTGDIKSIMILPFGNFTGSDSLDYFVAGMHSSLITEIGRISGLKVINKTTSNTYKNSDMSIHEMATELGVDVVIEGDIMCLGDNICSEFRVIRGSSDEELLWSEDYTEERKQILNFYKRITKQFADELRIELTPQTESYLAESSNVVPAAYDAYVRGMIHVERLNFTGQGPEDMLIAMEYFKTAIDIEPQWADPYAAMAFIPYSGWGDSLKIDGWTYLNKALELDSTSAKSRFMYAMVSVWPNWDWEQGEKQFLKSLEVNPNDALCRIYYAHLLLILRRTGEAVKQAELALELDPRRPLVLALYAQVMFATGNNQAGLIQSKKAVSIDPKNTFAQWTLPYAYLCNGDTLKWYETSKGWETIYKYMDSPDSIFREQGYYGLIEARTQFAEEYYTQFGLIDPLEQAENYLILGDFDKAMDYYEKAYEDSIALLSYVSDDYLVWPELKDNPRYINLLKKMNLPLPND